MLSTELRPLRIVNVIYVEFGILDKVLFSLCGFSGAGMSFATVVEQSTEKGNRLAIALFGTTRKKMKKTQSLETQSKSLSNGLGTHSAQFQL